VGLDAAYLKRQYQNFQQGLRGAHPEDKYGRQMKMMSTSLPSDKDLDDVIAYIQSMAASS
jgi:cytochrome c553